MEFEMTYCHAVSQMPDNSVHRHYHDHAYGFPILDDHELFGRLLLEINQAGLSWTTILNKKEGFRKAYDNFSLKKVAAYTDRDRERLLNDSSIIRNRLKIDAAIHNAGVILELQKDHGSFYAWIEKHHPLDKAGWVKLFRKTFKFTGGEIVNEYLMSTGWLPGAHHPDCSVFKKILEHKPAWMKNHEK
jgi:DNA-3-methyladenine glycosylase I